MREYRFQATDETLSALRRLRASWQGYVIGDMSFTVLLADGNSVRLEIEPVDVEGVFDAYRISAAVNATPRSVEELDGDTPKDWPTAPVEDPGSFANGNNDIVLFTGASWSEPSSAELTLQFGENSAMTFSGSAGQVTETAEIVCITTDAMVVASASGYGLLVRVALKPEWVEVVRDQVAVRSFLVERNYAAE